MNKLGIWGIVIAGAFFVGVFSANPSVEAVGGWKAAFDDLLAQITSNDTDIADLQAQINALTGEHIIRFDSGNNQEVNVNPLFFINGNNEGSPLNGFLDFRRGATLVGVDGEITELRYDIGPATINGITITVSLWKNNAVIASCSVVTAPTSQSCVDSITEPVSAGDLIAVSDVSIGQTVPVSFRHAAVIVTT